MITIHPHATHRNISLINLIKICLLVFFLGYCITFVTSAQHIEIKRNTVVTWVFFKDKGNVSASDIESYVKSLPQNVRARRAKVNPSNIADERDLPVNKYYVDKVIALGARHRATTRWLNGISIEATDEIIDAIEQLPFVKEVKIINPPKKQLNLIDSGENTLQGRLPYGSSKSQLKQINVTALQNMGYSGKGVIICVIDSGFKTTHEALKSVKVIDEHDFVNDDGETADEAGDYGGQDAHGTEVLSVIGGFKKGNLIGPAYNAKYLLAKTEDMASEFPVEEDYWLEAVEWADEKGAEIISSSLGYYDFEDGSSYTFEDLDGETATVTKAANIAAEKGILVVNSAGNGNLMPPADGKHLIAVGAVEVNGDLWQDSGSGPTYDGRVKPDVVARGFETYCADPNNNNKYLYKTGTSFATPLVAGLAALLLEAHPDWTQDKIREAILNTSDRSSSPDNSFGYGIPNGVSALKYALSITTEKLPAAKADRKYIAKLNASGKSDKLIWSIVDGSGLLPSGLTMSKSGVISGKPAKITSGQIYTFTVKASDSGVPGKEITKELSIKVKP
ncbi:MAG: S8 family serine peptidase [Candidatus Schekmanbacteria bacterium]|nr:S8 family serine peptidase [Candidatus Schekmanbacteria bacterium]